MIIIHQHTQARTGRLFIKVHYFKNGLYKLSSEAFPQEGKCLDCTACYDKDVKTVAYVGHGVSMKKNQKLISVVGV